MNNSLFVLNQALWFVLAVVTLGLVALAWKKPINRKADALAAAVVAQQETKPEESTLMVVHVRKIHTPGQLVS